MKKQTKCETCKRVGKISPEDWRPRAGMGNDPVGWAFVRGWAFAVDVDGAVVCTNCHSYDVTRIP